MQAAQHYGMAWGWIKQRPLGGLAAPRSNGSMYYYKNTLLFGSHRFLEIPLMSTCQRASD